MTERETSAESLFSDGLIHCSDTHCIDVNNLPAIERVEQLADIGLRVEQAIEDLEALRRKQEFAEKTDFMAVRNEILEVLNRSAGRDVYALLDGEISVDTLNVLRDAMTGAQEAMCSPGERSLDPRNQMLTEAWMDAIVCMITARAQLMGLAIEHPYATKIMTSPQYFAGISTGLRLVYMHDILRGKEQSIILKLHADAETRAYDEQSLLDFGIHEELVLDEATRNQLTCVALGAKASGAQLCPLQKRFGICREVANEVDLVEFLPLQRSITTYLQKERERLTRELVLWAKKEKSGTQHLKAYDIGITETPVATVHPEVDSPRISKRASRRVGARSPLERSNHTPIETIMLSETKLLVGGDEFCFAVAGEVDEQKLAELVSAVVHTKMIQESIGNHRESTSYQEFLTYAITSLVRMDSSARQASKRLRDVAGATNQYGVLEKAYRLSGRSLPGGGGGKLGCDTRILYTYGAQGTIRYLTIRAVMHRSDPRYRSNLRTFFR